MTAIATTPAPIPPTTAPVLMPPEASALSPVVLAAAAEVLRDEVCETETVTMAVCAGSVVNDVLLYLTDGVIVIQE